MAKYHELVKKYSEEIASIKEAMKKRDEFVARATAMGHDDDGPMGLPVKAARLLNVADDLQIEANIAWEKLAQDIEQAYQDASFSKSREQGIEGFWREAGLSPC